MIVLSKLVGTEEKNPGSIHQSSTHSFLALGEGKGRYGFMRDLHLRK